MAKTRHSTDHQNGGSDEIDVTGLTGAGSAAHDTTHENGGADEITIAGLAGISVELAAHLADATDAHDASAISFTPGGSVAATDVQAAILEVAAEAGAGTSVATDAIWDAAGDLVQGTGANTAAKLTLGAAGTVVRSTGSTNAYAYPPGYEMDRVTGSSVTVAGTSSAGATTILTGNAITYDGATVVDICYFAPSGNTPAASPGWITVCLFEGSTNLGNIGVVFSTLNTANIRAPVFGKFRLTPTAASHTYLIKAYRDGGAGTATLAGGAAGSDVLVPMEMRIVKV